jgi:hypothetical protein
VTFGQKAQKSKRVGQAINEDTVPVLPWKQIGLRQQHKTHKSKFAPAARLHEPRKNASTAKHGFKTWNDPSVAHSRFVEISALVPSNLFHGLWRWIHE